MPVLKIILSLKINEILNPEYVRARIEETILKEVDVEDSLVRLIDAEIFQKEKTKPSPISSDLIITDLGKYFTREGEEFFKNKIIVIDPECQRKR